MIAEESTTFPNVTKPVSEGGLGFDYKWNLGWMNDSLFYCRQDPYFRNHHHNKITFSLVYAFSERYILPLSHDEVVHVKGSIVNKMSGSYEDKFAGERALLGYMYAHPGKKLNFMGGELGHLREWDESRELDWDILKYPKHDSFNVFMKTLNNLYLTHSAFFEQDFQNNGFRWIDCNNTENCIYAIERKSSKETLVAVFNLSGTEKEYSVGGYRKATLLLNTDWNKFGGDTLNNEKTDITKLKLPSFSGVLFQVE